MIPAPRLYHLSDADLSALAAGDFTVRSIHALAAAESSKHVLLLEALRRASDRLDAADGPARVADSVRVLSEIQPRAPDVVRKVLALPHLGFWAADCLAKLSGASERAGNAPAPTPADLAHLAGFAAVAALRTGHSCELTLPVRDGMVYFPATGLARLGGRDEQGWARLQVNARRARVAVGSHVVDLPVGTRCRWRAPTGDWSPVHRLRARSRGITLEVVLEDADPFLTLLGPPAADRSRHVPRAWLRRLQQAWRILTHHHRATALGLATGLTTLVPLRDQGQQRPLSATSGLAWGAIALSLRHDALSVAETLFHEFHHLVLSAIDDIAPLVANDGGPLRYAPWRDDPRPVDGLIQGTYAYFGMARFWRQQRRGGRRGQRMRGEAEFARERHAALSAARDLAESTALTETGRLFTATMVRCLTDWQQETVPLSAEAMACEAATEHWLRWRLTHVRPDEQAIDSLARAWVAGLPHAPVVPDLPVTLAPWTRSWSDGRSHLLTLRYRDPRRLDRALRDRVVAASDAALLRGEAESARNGYLRDIRSGASPGAWVGLILTRRRLAGRQADWLVAERSEVIVAVYERAGELADALADPEALMTWLAPAS